VFFDIDDIADQKTWLPHMLPTHEEFEKKVTQLGVQNSDHIVVYDHSNGSFIASARVWWTFRVRIPSMLLPIPAIFISRVRSLGTTKFLYYRKDSKVGLTIYAYLKKIPARYTQSHRLIVYSRFHRKSYPSKPSPPIEIWCGIGRKCWKISNPAL